MRNASKHVFQVHRPVFHLFHWISPLSMFCPRNPIGFRNKCCSSLILSTLNCDLIQLWNSLSSHWFFPTNTLVCSLVRGKQKQLCDRLESLNSEPNSVAAYFAMSMSLIICLRKVYLGQIMHIPVRSHGLFFSEIHCISDIHCTSRGV